MRSILSIAALLLLVACAGGPGTRADALQRAQYEYSAAIRWNQFEVAAEFIDPAVRDRQPLDSFELERLRQNRVVGYTVISRSLQPEGGERLEIELRLVNLHTQAERVLRVRETWRWDPTAKRWWQSEGLPGLARP